MTFVITVVTHNGLWQMSDHQLTVGNVPLPGSSLKQIYLEAEDGKALIAYAGIGKVGDMEISKWVMNVLKDQRRTVDGHMAVLCEAAKEIVPYSMRLKMAHTFSIAAYRSSKPVFFAITNRTKTGADCTFRTEIINLGAGEGQSPVIINLEGLGAKAVSDCDVKRQLMKTIRNPDRWSSGGQDVGELLADLNAKASADSRSKSSVSENCLVTYLEGPESVPDSQFYRWDSNLKRPMLLHMAGGFDVTAIVKAIMPFAMQDLLKALEATKKGEPIEDKLDLDELNDALRREYGEPSDKLG